MTYVHMSSGETVEVFGYVGEQIKLCEDDMLKIVALNKVKSNDMYIFRWSAVDYVEVDGEEVTGE